MRKFWKISGVLFLLAVVSAARVYRDALEGLPLLFELVANGKFCEPVELARLSESSDICACGSDLLEIASGEFGGYKVADLEHLVADSGCFGKGRQTVDSGVCDALAKFLARRAEGIPEAARRRFRELTAQAGKDPV
jgi:hypothetical protein